MCEYMYVEVSILVLHMVGLGLHTYVTMCIESVYVPVLTSPAFEPHINTRVLSY